MNFLHQLATATLRNVQNGGSPHGWAGNSDAVSSMYLDDMHGARGTAERAFALDGRLLIIGPPGGGKTTLLRARARALAEAFLGADGRLAKPTRVPLYISATHLRDHLLTERSIVGSLVDHCEKCLGARVEADKFDCWLADGRIEVIVDGLDELGFDWNLTVAELSDIFRTKPRLCGIVASRPAALTVKLTNFTAYTIVDLNLAQIQDIVMRMAADQPHLAERFSDALNRSPQIAALARNPLLLNIMLVLFTEIVTLPLNRAVLISTTIELLLRRWAQTQYHEITPHQSIYEVLAAAAANMFEQS